MRPVGAGLAIAEVYPMGWSHVIGDVSRRWPRTFLLVLLAIPGAAQAQSADNVLVVINEQSPASIAVGGHYVQARSIPRDQVVLLRAPTEETITSAEYGTTIETPIAQWMAKRGLQDRVLYIVLTKGVPIRIRGTGGINGSEASVDSELTLLYRKMVGSPLAGRGRETNPYFLGDRPVADAQRFTRFSSDIYLVTRLDGYTVEEVLRLIDRGVAPARQGKVVLDQRRQTIERTGGDQWLADAGARLEVLAPGTAVLDETKDLATTGGPVLGYFSWGSNDGANRQRGAGLNFAPGALAGMFVSTDGRTFQEPPSDWRPGLSNKPAGVFGSGSQSMAADLIREGATGVSAHVGEPYLDGTVRPQVLFPAYLSGFNLAESFYLAMPYLGWRNMVIGDPLCAPFRTAAIPAAEIAKDIDTDTEHPALFAQRRLETLGKTGFNRQALQWMLRGDARLAREDEQAAEKFFRLARDLEPRLVIVSLQLAALYERRKDYEPAIAEYRRVLSSDPRNVIALNNLAYSLAVRQQKPKEALPFAEQAFSISRQSFVADTLGWIHFLLGNHKAAAPLIELAAAASPGSAEIQLHAAFVRSALGQNDKARAALESALKLDPALMQDSEIKDLKKRIEGGSGPVD